MIRGVGAVGYHPEPLWLMPSKQENETYLGKKILDKEYKKMSKDPEPGMCLACLKNSMVSRVAITFVQDYAQGWVRNLR